MGGRVGFLEGTHAKLILNRIFRSYLFLMNVKRFFIERRERSRLTWKSKILLLVALLAIVLIPYRFWLTGIGKFLISEDSLEVSDAIMVLSGGSIGRLDYGVKLFKEGYGQLFFLSEGEGVIYDLDLKWSDVALPRAVEAGVPQDKIIMIRNITSTYEEAISSRTQLTNYRVKSLILVTEPYHTFRSCATFRKALRDQGVAIVCRPSPSDWFYPDKWWSIERGLIVVNNEYLKLAFYLIKGYI